MINTTIRLPITIQAGTTEVKDLLPFFKQLEGKIPENALRRFQSAKICGKLPDGKPRAALVVGDKAEEQLEYVDAKEDFIVKTAADFQKLFIVTSDKSAANAIIVIQF